MEEAASNVGAGNGCWIIVLAIFSGGFSVILGGLIAGEHQANLTNKLKWGIICMILEPILIGWILACCIACKSKSMSGWGKFWIFTSDQNFQIFRMTKHWDHALEDVCLIHFRRQTIHGLPTLTGKSLVHLKRTLGWVYLCRVY